MLFTLKVSNIMTDLIIKKLPYDLSSHAGLAFVGKYLKRINLNALVDPAFPVRSGVANSEILKSYLALLCLDKNDFDAIENFRSDAFFKRALGLGGVPSSPTLRQRLDAHASSWFDLAAQMNRLLLGSSINGKPIDFGRKIAMKKDAQTQSTLQQFDPIFPLLKECEEGRDVMSLLKGPVCHGCFKRLN